MKSLKVIILVVLSFLGSRMFAQIDLSKPAEKLDTAINSNYSDLAPVFSRDGKTMYFHRLNHPENRFDKESQDIWYSELENGQWTPAKRCSDQLNMNRYNAVYHVLADGRLLINGRYTRNGQYAIRGMSLIPAMGNNTFGETEPFMVKAYKRKSDGQIASVGLNDNSTVMITSFGGLNKGKINNLYVSYRKKNKFTKPKKLKGIKSSRSQESPYLSSDGKTIYFSSNHGNKRKNYDLYSSTVLEESQYKKWSEPVKLTGDVNSESFDGFFVVDPAEEYAYFTSARGNENNTSDIYRIKLKEIQGKIKVQGFVTDIESGKRLSKDVPYALQVSRNDSLINVASLRTNRDSAYFEFEVPFGHEYELMAIASGYEAIPVIIDLSDLTDAQEFNKDAKVKLVKSDTVTLIDTVTQVKVDTVTKVDTVKQEIVDTLVDVSGKITGTEDYDFVAIYANGDNLGTPKMTKEGNYSMQLPKGKKYTLIAKKPGYKEAKETLDLTDVSIEEATVNYNLEKKPVVSFIDIEVLNRKDSSHLNKAIYDVYLDGKKLDESSYVKNEDGFELDLKIGAKYFLMVKSHDFIEAHDSLDFSNVKERYHVEKQFYLVPLEEGATVQIKNIYFDLGKSDLRPVSFTELNLLKAIMNDHPDLKIEISGHTDNRGNAYLNKKLSGERALSVRDYLIGQGVSPDRMTSKGYGFDKPIAANNTEENRARNRRVEFTILSNNAE